MRNKIILVTGCPAAGKSTFSLKLSKLLNLPCLNKDIIKEIMGDGYGPESGEVFQKGSAVTFSLMLHIAERFLLANQICILESNFKPTEAEHIKNLLDKYDCGCLSFAFSGNLDVLGKRYFERDKERHWVHGKAKNEESIKHYALNNKILEVSIGQTINVDATDFEKIDYEELLTIAKQFLANRT